jgi:hypothetical protein
VLRYLEAPAGLAIRPGVRDRAAKHVLEHSRRRAGALRKPPCAVSGSIPNKIGGIASRLFRPHRRLAATVALGALIVLQYGWVLRKGVLHLEIVQEPWRNNFLSAEWRNKAALESYLRTNPPAATVLMQVGYLGSSVLLGGLHFKDIVFDGYPGFAKFLQAVPPQIQTVIMKEGDRVWRRLRDDTWFNEQFKPTFTSPQAPRLIVYQRRAELSNADASAEQR